MVERIGDMVERFIPRHIDEFVRTATAAGMRLAPGHRVEPAATDRRPLNPVFGIKHFRPDIDQLAWVRVFGKWRDRDQPAIFYMCVKSAPMGKVWKH